MSTQTLEERIAVVEAEIEVLKEKERGADGLRGWQRIVGVFANNSAFEDAVRAGKEWRESKDPMDDEDFT